jgi:DNA polymerase-3 subunit beta
MKFQIDRAVLLRALSHIQNVVERRNTIPILANVKIDADKQAVTFTATDMDIALVEQIPAKVKDAGTTTMPAHMLYDIVRKMPEGSEVEISTDAAGGRAEIKAASSRFTLSCLPASDFPVMAEGEFSHQFTLGGEECRDLIEKTRFAVSTEETRYYLNGIYLHAAQSEGIPVLRSVATDGHRLARSEVAIPSGADGMPSIIIPRKTVSELKRLLDDHPTDVQISVSDTKIRIQSGQVVLVSKLIDGTFPDYERVIPANNNRLLELDGKRFSQAVDRVSTVSSDKSRAVKILLSNGSLELKADNQEAGQATENMDVKYSSEPIEVGFNSRYLLEMMSQVESETVQFFMGDASAPALVRDPANVGALYVIMPMRI